MSAPEIVRKHRHTTREHALRVKEHNESKSDWKGVCHFCKEPLIGTAKQLMEHSCKEFEASREASS
jgi:hypothetical protein